MHESRFTSSLFEFGCCFFFFHFEFRARFSVALGQQVSITPIHKYTITRSIRLLAGYIRHAIHSSFVFLSFRFVSTFAFELEIYLVFFFFVHGFINIANTARIGSDYEIFINTFIHDYDIV